MVPKGKRGAPARRTAARGASRTTTRGRKPAKPKMPFSLILDPNELGILRKMAARENTSVASIIRRALHTVIFKSHPDLARNAIESEVDSFLDAVGNKIPAGIGGTAKRARLRNQLVSGLLGPKGKTKK